MGKRKPTPRPTLDMADRDLVMIPFLLRCIVRESRDRHGPTPRDRIFLNMADVIERQTHPYGPRSGV